MIHDSEGGKVFSVADETDNIVAAIQSGDTTRHYECTLTCCGNPVCVCGTVHLNFSLPEHEDEDNPIPPYKVDIDVVEKKLGYKDIKKVSNENLKFAKLLLSSMDDADFLLLWKLYFAHKNEKTEKAPIDSIEALFDFQQVENDGLQWGAVKKHAASADVESVRSAIEEQIPDIYKRLLKRHIKLKGIYAHCKKRHFSQQLQLPKVGRNDPCPCGSGKKYKKCCL